MFNYRIWMLAITACLGAFFFGYDIGFIGGAITLDSFKRDFGINASNAADISGNLVASMQAGCIVGAISVAFLTDKIGRRLGLIISGAITIVASVMQTVATGNLPLFYAGRVIGGVGVGFASTLVPLYVGETAPKEIRGKLLTLYSFFQFLGLSLAYWVDYACARRISPDGHDQWRVPVALQIAPAAGLCLGMIPLKESPRWLAKAGRYEAALETLAHTRMDHSLGEDTLAEFEAIKNDIESHGLHADSFKLKELLLAKNLRRLAIGVAVMVGQQLTGTTVFTYYAPIFFVQVGIKGSDTGLFATGIYGVVKAVFSMVFLHLTIEKVGRRPSLIWGGILMGSTMLVNACVLATNPVNNDSSTVSSASIAMIVMIYLFCVAYSGSWGPVPWTYIGEIFPNRIREYCVAVCAGALWAANFIMSKIVPIAIQNIGWRTFLMFAILNFAVVAFTFFFVRETGGVPLEGMDELFGDQPAGDLEHATKQAEIEITDEQGEAESPKTNHAYVEAEKTGTLSREVGC